MRYGAVHTRIWQSPDFRALPEDAKMLFLYLLTSPHANLTGLYLLPKAYAQDDMGWEAATLERAMRVLIERDMVRYDDGARVVWVVKYLKYNPIRNQKQAIGAANAVKTLPKIPLVCDFVRAAIAYSPDYASHFDSLSIAYGCPIDSIANKTPTDTPTDTPTPTPDAHAREVSSSSSDGQAPSGTEPPEAEVIPERVWEQLTGRVVTSIQSQEIQQYLADGMEPEVVGWAIETAVAEGKRNWSYARGIIRNLFSEGDTPCLTMAQVREREAARQERSRADPPTEPDTLPEVTDAELRRLEWMVQMRRQEVAGDGNSSGNGTTDDAPVARRL